MRKVARSFEKHYWPSLIIFGLIAGLIPVLVHLAYVYGYGAVSNRELGFSMHYLKSTGFTISLHSGFFSVMLMTLLAAQSREMRFTEDNESRNPGIIRQGVVIAVISILTEIVFLLFAAEEFAPFFFFSPAAKAFAGVMTGTLREIG